MFYNFKCYPLFYWSNNSFATYFDDFSIRKQGKQSILFNKAFLFKNTLKIME